MIRPNPLDERAERRPPHVMMVNIGYPPNTIGGTEIVVQALARALADQGSTVSVVSLSANGADDTDENEGVRIYFVAAHPMGIALLDPERTMVKKALWHAIGELNIWSARKLNMVLRREKPDVIHTHSLLGLSTSVWGVARAHGIPIVHTLHDHQLLCPRGTMFCANHSCDTQCNACRWLTVRRRRASIIPNAVVGISESILRVHRMHGYFPNAIPHLIPNGLPPAISDDIRPRRNSTYPWRIGFIGRLHPIKGVELFIDALKELPSGTYIGRIAGAGNAKYAAQLKARARGYAIEFLGWVPSDKFFSQIDLLVVPSLYSEPQGLVLLEGARLGIPVIYARRGGLAEMGAAFSKCIAFEPTDPGSLGNALRAVVSVPPIMSAGHVPLPARFTNEAFIESYRLLYERLRPRIAAG